MKITSLIMALLAGFVIVFLVRGFTSDRYAEGYLKDVQFRGHDYIIFKVSGDYGNSYVHNPDCACHER